MDKIPVLKDPPFPRRFVFGIKKLMGENFRAIPCISDLYAKLLVHTQIGKVVQPRYLIVFLFLPIDLAQSHEV